MTDRSEQHPAGFDVVIGVDTHSDFHVAAVLGPLGELLGTEQFSATTQGYQNLLEWAGSFGRVVRAGVEGTGSYGAALNRFLHASDVTVVEVNRPNRAMRRRLGKSDTVDAEAAARAVMSGEATVTPKQGDGLVEALRVLKIAKDSATKSKVQAVNQLRAVLVNASPDLREILAGLALPRLLARCAAFDDAFTPSTSPAESAARGTLGRLARRVVYLQNEIDAVQVELEAAVATLAPQLLKLQGVGADTAAVLLIAAGDNPDRLRSEASFAALCGVIPSKRPRASPADDG